MTVPSQLRLHGSATPPELLIRGRRPHGNPLPPNSESYEPVPDTYRLTTAYVTIFYRLAGEEIDSLYVRPNT